MFNKRKHTDEEIKMLNSKAYRNGFLDGMSLDQKHPQTFTFMGVGIEKLTEIVCKNLDKENKMTREEARKIVFNKCKTLEGRESEYLIDAIEALGLIKFDEPSPIERETIKLSKFADDIGYMGSINGLLGLAEKHGLSIKEDNPK